MLGPGETADGFDSHYVPQLDYIHPGDCDIHYLAVAASVQLVFVNTLFS